MFEHRNRKAEAKSHKAEPKGQGEIQEVHTLSGRILAGSLVPEPKTSLKCYITCLVSGTNLRFSKKKNHFFLLSFEEAFGSSSSLTTIVAARHMGRASAKHASAWSGGWVASTEMPFPWVKAPACGETFPADAIGLRIAWRGAPRRGADRLNAAALSCPRR